MAMKIGQSTIRVMELLDKAHTDRLGIPEPVKITQNKVEGKAVVILIGLFSLGTQDSRIGPKAPEFISPGVLEVLQESFNLQLITTAVEDMDAMYVSIKESP